MTRIAALQMTSGPDVAANLDSARALLEESRAAGAAVALLPENFSFMGGQGTDKRRVAEDFGSGPVQDFLSATAARLGLWIIGGTTPLKGAAADGHSASP